MRFVIHCATPETERFFILVYKTILRFSSSFGSSHNRCRLRPVLQNFIRGIVGSWKFGQSFAPSANFQQFRFQVKFIYSWEGHTIFNKIFFEFDRLEFLLQFEIGAVRYVCVNNSYSLCDHFWTEMILNKVGILV